MKWYEKFANWISTRGGKRVMYRPNETGQPAKYLERFYIVKTPFIEIMLHRFFMSDAGELHDHPWHSFGWILAKGYNETVLDKNNQEITYFRSVGYFGARSAKSFHRVQLLADGVGIPFNHYFKSNGTLEVQELPQHYEGWVFPRKVMTP